MADNEPALTATARTIAHGKVLVHAIEPLATIEPTGPIESAITGLLLTAYRRLLRAMVATSPACVSEEILSASERIADDRAGLGVSDN